jgi:hypothetical protein
VETSEGKGGESAVAIPRFSMWWPPPMSVKDRGVGTRKQVLNVPIACRCCGPDKPSSLRSIDVWLSLLLQWLCWERNWVAAQPGWGLCLEPFFSGAVGFVQRCWWLTKGCHVRGPPTGSVHRAYVDWHGKRTCRVGWVFPYRVYIDSNRRDSRI